MSTVILGTLDAFTNGIPKTVTADGRVLVVIRIEDSLYVLDDRCSHEDFALSEGDVDVTAKTIECVRHGAYFDLETGDPKTFPATRPVATYEVVNVNGTYEVVVP
jgi:3-phenylpropionate/trans-cinnamate dioxygenase ferredoxin subunit